MTEPWNLSQKTNGDAPEDRHTAAQTGALELAYIGDCVFELIVRTRLLQETGKKVKEKIIYSFALGKELSVY